MAFALDRLLHLLRVGGLGDTIAQHKHAKNIGPQSRILPTIDIERLTNSIEPTIAEEEHADGNVSVEELRCIAKLAQHFQPKSIFEIGTFDGRTTLNMALNAPESHIWTLDLPRKQVHKTRFRIKKGDQTFVDKDQSGSRFLGTPQQAQITQIYADSAGYDYADLNGTMDMVFIDGAHTYEYVLNDTEVAFKLLRDGNGVLLWHDYEWKEVIYALNQYFENDARFKSLQHIEGTTLAILIVE